MTIGSIAIEWPWPEVTPRCRELTDELLPNFVFRSLSLNEDIYFGGITKWTVKEMN
jgi:hypothetical protein